MTKRGRSSAAPFALGLPLPGLSLLGLSLLGLSLLGVPAARAAEEPAAKSADATPTTSETYEALAKNATRTHDVATLLGPFIDRCDAEKRDLERARCRTTQAYLREVLPTRTFVTPADDPAVI